MNKIYSQQLRIINRELRNRQSLFSDKILKSKEDIEKAQKDIQSRYTNIY